MNAAVNSPGNLLPDHFRRNAERFFGRDLGHVRIHDDSLAATATAESRAHALAVGDHILLSRGRRDLSQPDTGKTLAHEIAHTLQATAGHAQHFEADNSGAETEASAAANAFVSSMSHRPAIHRQRHGVVRDRDPRLDDLVSVIDGMPLVLTSTAIVDELYLTVPDLDLSDPDNYEQLSLLLDEHFGSGIGADVLAEWRSRQTRPSTAQGRRASSSATAQTTRVAEPAPVVSAVPPQSMTGTDLESEIDLLRAALGMPRLNEDAPTSEPFEPHDSDDQLRLDRLVALESEYFERRRLLESARETTRAIAEQQREQGVDVLSVVTTGLSVIANPTMAPLTIAGAVLGNPVEDFGTGFLPGFAGGAMLELPRDVFQRLDTETREHPIAFNGGVMLGIPVGALQGLRDMVVGLVELLELANRLSPTNLTIAIVEEAIRNAVDDEHTARRLAQLRQALEMGEAISDLIRSMISDQAFMIAHGQELGEIAGRAAAHWFSTDFMSQTTFQKGYLVGRVEGRILFEVLALFIGPEEWIARGATLIGEGARISGRLLTAIMEFVERIPVLRRLLTAGREVSVLAREAAAGERVVAETGEVLSEAGRFGDEAGELTRAGERAEEAIEPARVGTAEARALDAADLNRVGEVNPETMRFFERHPERLRAWAENPLAQRACKLCSSPCFPENVNPAQAERLEGLLNRAESQGLTVREHILHDELSRMSEAEIDSFINRLDEGLNEMPTDLTSVIDEATEGTSRSLAPDEAPDVPTSSREVEEQAADLGEARLTPREPWRAPPGSTPRPPDTAPIQERVEWLRERLQMHVDDAVEHFNTHGVTTAQERALLDNPDLYPAFRGSRIDQFAKDTIMQDLELGDLITAPDFVAEPDILSSAMPEWFDVTTAQAWQRHLQRYAARYGTSGVLLPTR